MKRWIAATAAALMVCTASVAATAASANAVFDFQDKVFLTLPMQQEESIYLSLNTDYDRQLAQLVYEQTDKRQTVFIALIPPSRNFCAPQHCFCRQMKTSSCMNWMRTDNWFW